MFVRSQLKRTSSENETVAHVFTCVLVTVKERDKIWAAALTRTLTTQGDLLTVSLQLERYLPTFSLISDLTPEKLEVRS